MGTVRKDDYKSEIYKIMNSIYKRGHWGHHGNGGNGWVGYLIVLGIIIAAFFFVGLFT